MLTKNYISCENFMIFCLRQTGYNDGKNLIMRIFVFCSLLLVIFSTESISQVNITFQVNMKNQDASEIGVFLKGSFNGWNSNEPMLRDGNVYSATIPLSPGEYIEYKYVNGTNSWENILGECSVGEYKNRWLIVPEIDSILDPVCFNNCSNCLEVIYDPDIIKPEVEPLIQNNWQTFMWPYNAYLPLSEMGPNGHIGNECGVTAMSRLIHYWQHTPNGTGTISASYFGVDYHCDLEALNLDYSNMPYELNWNEKEEKYADVAKLMLACATIGAKISIGFTDHHEFVGPALAQYFNFTETSQVIYRNDFSREEWIQIFKYELSVGRPILICGRTVDSPSPNEPGSVSGHYFICDGFNKQGQFYYNYMFSQIKEYADIDEMGEYRAHHYAIIGLEPERYEIKNEVTICKGQEYKGWTEADEYREDLTSIRGYDSIVMTTLHVIDLPVAEVTIENDNNCFGEVTTLTAPSGNYEYLWNTGETKQQIESTTGGEYSVIISQHNCSSNSKAYIVNKAKVPEKPIININENILSSTATGGNQWFNNNTIIEGANEQIFVITENGNYSVQVTSENGCTSPMSESIYVVYTSINNLNSSFQIYPSPTTGLLIISGLPKNEITNIKVFNINGMMVKEKQLLSEEIIIDLVDKPDGIYLISINGIINKTISKVKN